MSLSRCQGYDIVLSFTSNGINVGTVDEHIVAQRRSMSLGVEDNIVRALVVVVCQQQRAQVNVVVEACWSIDLNGANNAVAVLCREVGVYAALEICKL